MDYRGPLHLPRSGAKDDSDLKSRIFAAFEHACRYGDVEVADQLLAIINSKWMKQARGQPHSIQATAAGGPAGLLS